MRSGFALVDCNNFYASCERAFAPSLEKKPIIILSNNDGCVIARSAEAKALGIEMGVPLYLCKNLVIKHDIAVFSSNFSLYGDMSRRVVETLRSFGYPLEIYSIDESFLHIDYPFDPLPIREKILTWTGIPTSIGTAPTKTLAKFATSLAKKGDGAFQFQAHEEADPFLKKVPPGEIWGIGRKTAAHLLTLGITSAYAFKYADPSLIRKKCSVTLLRTQLELFGTPCIEENDSPEKKSICCSRSFGSPVTTLNELKSAIATFTARAAAKLRKDQSAATFLTVFTDISSQSTSLPLATNETSTLLTSAMHLTELMFGRHTSHKKGGVILSEISSAASTQSDLFTEKHEKKTARIADAINQKYGKNSLFFGAEKGGTNWKSKQENLSPKYTTSWDDLLEVR